MDLALGESSMRLCVCLCVCVSIYLCVCLPILYLFSYISTYAIHPLQAMGTIPEQWPGTDGLNCNIELENLPMSTSV